MLIMSNLTLKIVKSVAIFLLLTLSAHRLYSQTQVQSKKLFADTQLKLSISTLFYDDLDFVHYGEEILKSRFCFSGESVISLYKSIYKGFGINLGFGLGLVPYNFHYYYKSPDNQPYIGQIYEDFLNHYIYIQDIYIIPISIQKVVPLNKRFINGLSFEAGLKLNKKVAFPYEISTEVWYDLNDSTEIVLFDFFLNNTEKKNYLSYFLKFGVIKNTKKLNTLQCNFVLHFSQAKIGEGTYNFYYLPVESYGIVKQNLNYIGFEFTYGLTLTKKVRRE